MKVTIQVSEDPNFKLIDVAGELIEDIEPKWALDPSTIPAKVEVINPPIVEAPVIPPQPSEYYPVPKPVPLDNYRSTDAGSYFGGTSWATK